MNLRPYRKIIVLGSPGSGKSVASRRLGEALSLPVIHLDNEFWKPGWVETPREEWIRRQEELISGKEWIIDGNYGSTMELRFRAAELVIFLDIGRVKCAAGALRRVGRKRPDLPDYLDEKLDREFLQFLKFIWSYPRKGRVRLLELHRKYPDIPFIAVKKRSEIEKLISASV